MLALLACSDYAVQGEPDPPACALLGAPESGIAVDPSCTLPRDPPGGFDPVVEWTRASWSDNPLSRNVMMPPVVGALTDDDGDGDADADDVPALVFTTYYTEADQRAMMRAVRGTDGAELWSAEIDLNYLNGLALGDLDGDGWAEIVAMTNSRTVLALDAAGAVVWTSENVATTTYPFANNPAISDMDGDGSPEIVVGATVFDANGQVLGRGEHGMGSGEHAGTASFAIDLDGDGVQEVVAGNAVYRRDGSTIWYNGTEDGYPAVADIDGDGVLEIVVSGGGGLRIQYADGVVRCTERLRGGEYGGAPTVEDLDGDGTPEITVATQDWYTAYDTACQPLWSVPIEDRSSGMLGSVAVDLEGDGAVELVYADETRLRILAGADGHERYTSADHSSVTLTEYAVVADVDGDGSTEIVVPNNGYGGDATGITVFGDAASSWRRTRSTWNQYAWHQANVAEDGSLPRAEDPTTNFRSAVTPEPKVAAADLDLLFEDVCTSETGRFVAYVAVENTGGLDAPAGAVLEVYGVSDTGELLMDSAELPVVPAGVRLGRVRFDLEAAGLTGLAARVDVREAVTECDEADGYAVWSAP